jgi:hypothetical protein
LPDPEALPDLSLRAFVAAIAEPRPAPGAGAAGAAALALAAACAGKAFRLGSRHGDEDLATAADRCGAIAAAALESAVRDAEDFTALLKGRETAPRAPIEPARALAEDATALLVLEEELRTLAATLGARVPEPLRGDLVAAEALLDASAQIRRANLSEL